MLRKLSALFRGSAHDAAQGVVDANALKILDQEIRDADNAQGKARDDLAGLVARLEGLVIYHVVYIRATPHPPLAIAICRLSPSSVTCASRRTGPSAPPRTRCVSRR